uniref:Uncharacterized protein n=1 Tax=Chromera velia CCMP2878 TaxID=1169474 RepID=A0A0G4I8C1_9ALVE|eukprot:Cvel_11903.t1-p1 / transcript=Cvel_11903.t1 / gene=Cvel_11903 / organism=Chromera_velia_CCMP2878 / gene_product=hypothetical protein / transcript_product=hypothetical protein / location=Cvel_scaffold761:66807-67223(+) / protein_length=139 / sequence_SO=supercontig / SO=protein_coding / is_pseudo=false
MKDKRVGSLQHYGVRLLTERAGLSAALRSAAPHGACRALCSTTECGSSRSVQGSLQHYGVRLLTERAGPLLKSTDQVNVCGRSMRRKKCPPSPCSFCLLDAAIRGGATGIKRQRRLSASERKGEGMWHRRYPSFMCTGG